MNHLHEELAICGGKAMKTSLLLGAIALIMGGCVSYYLAPNELYGNQAIIYVDGYEAITDQYYFAESNGLTVTIFGYPTNDVIVLQLLYGNETSEQINVLPDQVVLEGMSNRRSHSLKVWEANAYIRRIKGIQNTALILQAIGGAMEAASAGTSTTQTYGSYYGSTRHGSYSGTYRGYSRTYDSSKVAEASARNISSLIGQANANAKNIEYLNAVLLKRNTLQAYTFISGSVYCERKFYPIYRITVPFGDKQFVFSFKLVKD
jgi:hypothetical protein